MSSKDQMSQSEIDKLLCMLEKQPFDVVGAVRLQGGYRFICIHCLRIVKMGGVGKDTKTIKLKGSDNKCHHFLYNIDYLKKTYG